MNKSNNIIIINGRHYDAKTGVAVSHAAKPVARVAGRKPASHAAGHRPKPSSTLMRQAVKKPPGSLKRHIKVQGHLGDPPAPPRDEVAIRPLGGQFHSHRPRHYESKNGEGRLISHFSPDLFVVVGHVEAAREQTATTNNARPHAVSHPASPPRKPRTTAELLDYAVQQASVPQQPAARRKHHKSLLKRRVRS